MAGEWATKRLGKVAGINPDTIVQNWPHPHIRYIDISSVGVGQIEVPPQWMRLSDAPSRANWTVRENVRAQMRLIIKRILRKYGYPPDKQARATEPVLEQAEVLCKDWTEKE